jgi:hypothetical protein
MTDLCPSCREPLDYPSGDGCAAMTLHQPVKGMVMSAAFWAAVRERMKHLKGEQDAVDTPTHPNERQRG